MAYDISTHGDPTKVHDGRLAVFRFRDHARVLDVDTPNATSFYALAAGLLMPEYFEDAIATSRFVEGRNRLEYYVHNRDGVISTSSVAFFDRDGDDRAAKDGY